MILLLEGTNGVGKTTYIRQLEKRLGWPSYSAFRGKADKYDPTMLAELKRLGVPVNTFVDEMYMVDLVRATGIDIIVDRSFPSAVAYDQVFGQDTFLDIEATSKIWLDLVKEAGMLYVWLSTSFAVAHKRCAARPIFGFPIDEREHEALENHYSIWYNRMTVEKMMLNTAHINVAEGVEKICRTLTK